LQGIEVSVARRRLDLEEQLSEVRVMLRQIQEILATAALLALGFGGATNPAAAETATGVITVRIIVSNDAAVPDHVLSEARRVASLIYRNAGIETAWPICSSSGGQRGQGPECQGPFGPLDLFLRIRPTCAGMPVGQGYKLGISLMPADGAFGSYAYVFFDRVQAWPRENWQPPYGRRVDRVPLDKKIPLLLGVVMAHEVGHLLLGSGSHSREGVMQPTWTRSDLEEAYWGSHGFIPSQEKQLHAKLWDRARP
jgi:hypothetical protein